METEEVKMEINLSKLQRYIQKNFVQLSTEINFDICIAYLYQRELITVYDYDSLMTKRGIKKNEEFLLNMDMYGEKAGIEFCIWLKTTHPKVYQTLCETDIRDFPRVTLDELELREQDRELIQQNYVMLVRKINAFAVAPRLFEVGFLNRDDMERIFHAPSRLERGRELVGVLIKCGATRQIKLGLYNSLTEVLRQQQPHLYEEFTTKSIAEEVKSLELD